jgi:guanosine-3',5'-bis(diphosphate) 3'-pyrophosphohydrolase
MPIIEAVFKKLVSDNFKGHTDILFRAKEFAREMHEGQVREGGGAYLIHPLRVAISIMSELGIHDETLVMAALLHDVVEDSDSGEELLATEFGDATAKLVLVLSRRPDEKRPAQGDSPESPYFGRIREAGEYGIVLKTADKVDNLRDALYHPSSRKRRVYVAEIDKVYLPLIKLLANKNLQGKLKALLRSAADSHSLKSLIALLDERTQGVGQGERVIVPPACLDAPLLHYLLFNPNLACWLSNDGIQLTKTQQSSNGLAAIVARKYAQMIEVGRVKELLDFAGVPTQLGNERNRQHWDKAVAQLQELIRLLQEDKPPAWCAPAFEPDSARWLLLIIHSVLLRPANWIFPMWHADYGATLAANPENSPYAHGSAESDIPLFHQFLRFLLTSREALWRFSVGTGTLTRAESVFNASASVSGIAPRTLWSARFLSEYLDVIARAEGSAQGRDVSAGFTELWDSLEKGSFQPETLSNEVPGRPIVSDVEFLGREEVREMFEKENRSKEFEILLSLLTGYCNERAKNSARWVSFETTEFLKRQELFAGLDLNESSRFEDLEKSGIRSRTETGGGTFVLKVFPARRFAIQNRLPELSPSDLRTIDKKAYSASAIFDTLILKRMKRPESVWVPRVYRILDTIEDLDSDNVQAIDITLRGPGDPALFKTFLPLPSPSNKPGLLQNRRKEILARYIVTQIYNYGITRCILSVSVQCAVLEASRSDCGFTNEGLMEMIQKAEDALGFRSSYGNFTESFNFSPFRISGISPSETNLPFGESDMRSGLFLGIDIGGTDVKYALFAGGEAEALKTGGSLGKFKTFRDKNVKHVAADVFCKRLVSEISLRLDNPKETWSQISGIGISWPGAVRENRIACISGTLMKLSYRGNSFNSKSPPTEIHSFPFLDLFCKALAESQPGINPELILENDGNAEAFGNYCSRVLENKNKPGGKLIVKLGTSLAGGRVRPDSSVADDVAEFSKIVLDLNVSDDPGLKKPLGAAREYVSSLGVRNLSRTFEFQDEPLFGPRENQNTEEQAATRIEAVELGELLRLWRAGVDDQVYESYMEELVRTDNRPDNPASNELVKRFQKLLSDGAMKKELIDYIEARGKEWSGRHSRKNSPDGKSVRQKGLERVHWLCMGKWKSYSDSLDSTLPERFPFDKLAEKIVGTVALFSQLGLQIAHLVAALYNIYRRDSFNEIILAGGVLSGLTGELIKAQTEAFLSKYYDKIYGRGKNLPLDAIQLAQSKNRELAGPLGVAMLANRAHKDARLKAMRGLVDYLIGQLPPGNPIRLKDVESALHERRISASQGEVLDCIYAKVAESILIPQEEGESFIKAVEASS